jgi:putative transposase
MDKWAYEHKVRLDFSRPEKPTDNAMVESFNGRLREECLNEHWFLSVSDAARKIAAWRQRYNESCPHSALDWATLALGNPCRVRTSMLASASIGEAKGAANLYF